MGNVTIRDNTGGTFDVPEADVPRYAAQGYAVETPDDQSRRLAAETREAAYGSVTGGIEAGVTSALGTATAGLSDVLIGSQGEASREHLRGIREAHPIASTAGGFAGAFLPGLGTAAGALGAGTRAALGEGLIAKTVAGAAEGTLYGAGQGVSDLALSRDPLTFEHAASTLSSNILFGGAAGGVTGAAFGAVERGLTRAKSAINDHVAAQAATSAIPADLATLDAAGLRAAHEAELEQLAQGQAAQRATDKSAAVDDVLAYRQQVKDANPWLVITEGEPAKQLAKANNSIRAALDDPKGLREGPGLLAKPLRVEEQALQRAVDGRAEIEARLDAQNVKIASGLEKELAPAAPISAPIPEPLAPEESFARHQSGMRSAVDSGVTTEGHPSISLDAQQGMRQEMSGIAKEYGLHHRLADADYADSIMVAHPGESNPALRMKHESLPAQNYNELTEFPGLIVVSPEQTRLLAEHARLSPSELKKLGSAAVHGDAQAHEKLFASHVMNHENLHSFGPSIEQSAHRSVVEELTTEMAARRITGDMHGAPASFVGTYDQVIDPIVDSVAKATGVPRAKAYDALERASLKFKGRSGVINADQAIYDLVGDTLDGLGSKSTEARKAIAQDIYKTSREIGTSVHDHPPTPHEQVGGQPNAPSAEPITLTGKAARRYASFADVKVPKGGSVTVERAEAQAFLDALKSGEVQGESRAALDKLGGLLEQNRALQAKLKTATAPILPKSELASPRLTQIKAAKDALATPKPKSAIEGMLGGSVFGSVTAAVHAIPVIGQIPGVAHFLGAKAAELANRLVFGKLTDAVAGQAKRASSAADAFLSGTKTAAKAAPVLATKVLGAVRYAASAADDKQPGVTGLAASYKARTDEVKTQTMYDATGTPRIKPEARQAVADKLQPIAALDLILADRLETLAVRRIEYLSSILPRRPDTGVVATGPDTWKPSDLEMRAWARSAAAADDPVAVLERAVHGAVTPEDAATLRAVHPEILGDFTNKVAVGLPTLKRPLPYQRRLALSMLTGLHVDPAMHPAVLAILQGQFAADGGGPMTQSPAAAPQFGSVKRSVPQPTPAQSRGQGAHS